MARKRDLVGEILGKRQRLRRTKRDRSDPFYDRSIALLMAVEHFRRMPRADAYIKQEMLRYTAVGLVSLIEGYTRTVITDLINSGSPFRERAVTLHDLRLDVAALLRMESARVSAGELVAHMVPLSSLEDVNRHLSTLLAADLFSHLRRANVRPDATFEESVPRAWETLAGLFADRHIACHELNPRGEWTFARAVEQWRATVLFRNATEVVVRDATPVHIKPRAG